MSPRAEWVELRWRPRGSYFWRHPFPFATVSDTLKEVFSFLPTESVEVDAWLPGVGWQAVERTPLARYLRSGQGD